MRSGARLLLAALLLLLFPGCGDDLEEMALVISGTEGMEVEGQYMYVRQVGRETSTYRAPIDRYTVPDTIRLRAHAMVGGFRALEGEEGELVLEMVREGEVVDRDSAEYAGQWIEVTSHAAILGRD